MTNRNYLEIVWGTRYLKPWSLIQIHSTWTYHPNMIIHLRLLKEIRFKQQKESDKPTLLGNSNGYTISRTLITDLDTQHLDLSPNKVIHLKFLKINKIQTTKTQGLAGKPEVWLTGLSNLQWNASTRRPQSKEKSKNDKDKKPYPKFCC